MSDSRINYDVFCLQGGLVMDEWTQRRVCEVMDVLAANLTPGILWLDASGMGLYDRSGCRIFVKASPTPLKEALEFTSMVLTPSAVYTTQRIHTLLYNGKNAQLRCLPR